MNINNPSLVIALTSGAMTLTAILFAAEYLRRFNALITLIAESAEICFLCHRGRLGHDILEDNGLLDSEHGFMPAYLVYVPDSDLR